MAMLADPLRKVVGDKAAKRLNQALDLQTVAELLGYYPRRYDTRGELTDLASLREGEHVTVQAEVAAVSVRKMRNRPGTIFEAVVTDGRGRLTLTFFGRGRQDWREKVLTPGTRGLFSGQVSSFRGKRQLSHPECELLGAGEPRVRAAEYAAELIPVYRASSQITSWQIADSVQIVLDTLDIDDDPLPPAVRQKYGLTGLADALRGIHKPVDQADRRRAERRLKWDEAFALQVILAQRRLAATAYSTTPRPGRDDGLLAAFDAALPFELTIGQQLAGATIADELDRDHPMHRLLQGEVGSGKTIIAIRAMLQVIDAAGQAALLAPTEVLAQQHLRAISDLLGPLARAGQLDGDPRGTRVALLTGSQSTAQRRQALLEAASGTAGILVGTHALLQDQVRFAELGLVVIDEQHRFGVEQRDALREKAGEGRPHLLVMTATPIPRTVAMTVFGDLDISTLTELPAGRSPISTHVVPAAEKPRYLARVWERVAEEVAAGRQAYVVCPRIGTEPAAGDAGGDMAAGDMAAGDSAATDTGGPGAGPRRAGQAGNGSQASSSGGSGDGNGNRGGNRGGTGNGGGTGNRGGTGGRAAGAGRSGRRDELAEDGALFGEDEVLAADDSGQDPGDQPDSRPAIAVLDLAPALEGGPLAGLRVAIMHGRLPTDEKDRVMRSFADGSVDVLVTTTVVEVGVDVPNATAMVIMDADRFGVSQLHQLRGRVGRGRHEGLCLLVTEAADGAKSRARLDAVAETLDGFTLSRLDLEQRKEGDVLGAAQAGSRKSLKLLTLLKDEELIGQARQEATSLVGADPALSGYPALAAAVRAILDQEQAEFLEKA
ncbi:MAG TPA: ATP-dependent DNA helicase RecG [Streptosporangiaceae bacterium]|jgi:ATP-dependent DNA helicase RecG